jgi:hypothetical protein
MYDSTILFQEFLFRSLSYILHTGINKFMQILGPLTVKHGSNVQRSYIQGDTYWPNFK